MEFFKTVFYFLVVIGVMVIAHEWGHYITAKWSGMRADIFSFGMGKRLFGWHRKTGFTFGELPEDFDYAGTTDWRFSLIPMGGYVKILGMVDESADAEFANTPPQPYEFRSKNVFQKSLVLCAGVIMNLILAIVIYAGIAYSNGNQIMMTNKIGYVVPNSIWAKIGLQKGDEVVSINNKPMTNTTDIMKSITLTEFGNDKSIIIKRDSQQVELKVPGKKILDEMQNQSKKDNMGLYPSGYKIVLNQIEKNKPASQAGLLANDTVVTLNNLEVNTLTEFTKIISENKGKSIPISLKRANSIVTYNVTPNESGKIGVALSQGYAGKIIIEKFNLVESLNQGVSKTGEVIDLILSSFGQMFKGNVKFKEAVAGPIGIAKQSSKSADMGLESFLGFMAMISISLAIMNILPFPALDGGHLVIVWIESLIRREIPIKVKLYIQNAAMIILLSFFAYVIYLDLMRL